MQKKDTSSVRGREQFNKYKKVFLFMSQLCRLLPLKTRLFLFDLVRFIPGKIGLGVRYILLNSIAENCGDNVSVFQGVYLLNPQNISIGSNVSIHPMSYIECGTNKTGITIGNNVSIAHGVTIMATSHKYDTPGRNIKDSDLKFEPVIIEDNVWIGAKASVLCGVKIKTGCIIGAQAVVTSTTEPNGIYAGVPAKRIKEK